MIVDKWISNKVNFDAKWIWQRANNPGVTNVPQNGPARNLSRARFGPRFGEHFVIPDTILVFLGFFLLFVCFCLFWNVWKFCCFCFFDFLE